MAKVYGCGPVNLILQCKITFFSGMIYENEEELSCNDLANNTNTLHIVQNVHLLCTENSCFMIADIQIMPIPSRNLLPSFA